MSIIMIWEKDYRKVNPILMQIMVYHHKKHMIDTYAVSVILTFGLVLEKVF